MPHNLCMINCNLGNFNVTRRLGFTSQGLKSECRRKVQRVEPGDRIIYYVAGIRSGRRRWIRVLPNLDLKRRAARMAGVAAPVVPSVTATGE